MSEKTIYNLGLHEGFIVVNTPHCCLYVIRVPGGWLYFDDTHPAIFIPFNDEFEGEP